MSLPGWDAPASPSMLEPASPAAGRIAELWWVFFGVAAVVWAAVVLLTLLAIARRRSGAGAAEPIVDPGSEPRARRATIAGTLLTVAALVCLLVASVRTGALLHRPAAGGASAPSEHLRIKVTAQRWWWQLDYPNDDVSLTVTTANELHVPVGRPVLLELSSVDVIHSLWLPELQGKRDLIPGRTTELELTVARPGVYRGQCAEFCGLQHAHMGLLLIAESSAAFEAWLQHQRQPAAPPSSPDGMRGQQVFMGTTCPLCHGVRGTNAAATRGPDLTHVASRLSLGAATFPNNRGHLAGWILDPQTLKTGNLMPPTPLPAEDFRALLEYLTSLK